MNITVYCGSNIGNRKIYSEAAQKVGKWIADNGNTLVYGGGATGLMKIIADSVLENGGDVIGIRPDFLSEIEPSHPNLTEFISVDTMDERKKLMMDKGDVYIALPGGPGTLEEISEVVSWAMIGKNSNPCVFFDVEDYYQPMIDVFDRMLDCGFMSKEHRDMILFTDSLEEIEEFVKNYKVPESR